MKWSIRLLHDFGGREMTSPPVKYNPSRRALIAIGRNNIAIRNTITFCGRVFDSDTPIDTSGCVLEPGGDYAVVVRAAVLTTCKLSSHCTHSPTIKGSRRCQMKSKEETLIHGMIARFALFGACTFLVKNWARSLYVSAAQSVRLSTA